MKEIIERYRNPNSFATNSLEYVVDKDHIVIHRMHYGEDIGPNIYRFDNIADARGMWKRLRSLINARGYTVRF